MEKWQEPFGDMRQELVFIGQNLDQARMREALDACLLSEAELLEGMEAITRPLPRLGISHFTLHKYKLHKYKERGSSLSLYCYRLSVLLQHAGQPRCQAGEHYQHRD